MTILLVKIRSEDSYEKCLGFPAFKIVFKTSLKYAEVSKVKLISYFLPGPNALFKQEILSLEITEAFQIIWTTMCMIVYTIYGSPDHEV